MRFVKSEKLKVGMRLARPIYNKNGVLLYERDSKLTPQGITSIQNFHLMGIFVLEPAEPVPPMTQDDLAFERFQTMGVFAIQEELEKILEDRKIYKISSIASDVIRNYGRADKKINFIQNLRSKEDAVYKHVLNVAILTALITHRLNMKLDEQMDTVICALVHDIALLAKKEDAAGITTLFEQAFPYSAAIKKIWIQYKTGMLYYEKNKKGLPPIDLPAQILLVADHYDTLTAMKLEGEPASEVKAIKSLIERPDIFNEAVVNALIQTIHILSPGTCIELENKDKGLVLQANASDVLRPLILRFKDNRIIDLGENNKYAIKDIMKTLDNRHVFDVELLKKYGYVSEQFDYEDASSSIETQNNENQ